MIDMQAHLLFITNRIVQLYNESNKLRGITAFWREDDETACLGFYLDGPVSDEDIEDASDLATGIISHFPEGFLEEEFFRLDYPQPLPESPFWGYRRPDSDPESIKPG
ncbi:MAG: hypothetical protein H0T62_00740 [Parachlamydiaceae bacterium]|nr:hypothetical protein [Parachlamydiaceae bacterium]